MLRPIHWSTRIWKMQQKQKFFLLLIMSAMVLMPTAATAIDFPVPLGYRVLCLKTPAVCKKTGASEIEYSKALLQKLKEVNRQVNAAITPVADSPEHDTWSVNVSSGDCEDYVLTKRVRLISLGFPSAALRIAVGMRSGEGHAVLVVHTTKDDYVLDNLSNRVWGLSSSLSRNFTQL